MLMALSKCYSEEYSTLLRDIRKQFPITASRTRDTKRYNREWGFIRHRALSKLRENHLQEYQKLMRSLRD